jgi:hypothetical protein
MKVYLVRSFNNSDVNLFPCIDVRGVFATRAGAEQSIAPEAQNAVDRGMCKNTAVYFDRWISAYELNI